MAEKLSGICAILAEVVPKLIEEDDKESFYESHKKTADRILSCSPWDYNGILDLQFPSRQIASEAFNILSKVLTPEGNIGVQYELAEAAYGCT